MVGGAQNAIAVDRGDVDDRGVLRFALPRIETPGCECAGENGSSSGRAERSSRK
jgi:hypothetical protein